MYVLAINVYVFEFELGSDNYVTAPALINKFSTVLYARLVLG